jgi:hypothetical protein
MVVDAPAMARLTRRLRNSFNTCPLPVPRVPGRAIWASSGRDLLHAFQGKYGDGAQRGRR